MKYNRVLRQLDGARVGEHTLVANELYTDSEMQKRGIPYKYTVPVEVSKKQVYISFGARFQVGTDHNTML